VLGRQAAAAGDQVISGLLVFGFIAGPADEVAFAERPELTAWQTRTP
jgi:hypothetical protein